MMPRFLKTFLLTSLLIFIPTLFIVYQKNSDGSEWNEWSLTSGTWDAWNPAQRLSSSNAADKESALYLEDHWNAGGASPKYNSPHIVDVERQEDIDDRRTLYRLGDTTIDEEELEAFKRWRTSQATESVEADGQNRIGETGPLDTWFEDASVHGGVIMPKLGNATAKHVCSEACPSYHV